MIVHADCLEEMARMESESVSAVVTDPPYGLSFMGKGWDHGVPGVPFWAEMRRVAKPGAHMLAFGGTRTVHRMTVAIEDAGWEIRDCLVWGYASGFPKSANPGRGNDAYLCRSFGNHTDDPEHICPRMSPDEWYGMGTALKPAWEPIVMARKPFRGTVPANVKAHGTGALNIDGARIATSDDLGIQPASRAPNRILGKLDYNADADWAQSPLGRWPANVILTDPIFDGGIEGVVGGGEAGSVVKFAQAGNIDGKARTGGSGDGLTLGITGQKDALSSYGDSGTYSRFFLIPKADRAEREPVGLRTFDQSRETAHRRTGDMDTPYLRGETLRRNTHPTVKPVDLMRHLVRLVTPPGGLVLDPFLGSGTTGIACEMEGFEWIGIEREAEYVAIAEARLHGVQKGMGLSA